MGKNKGEGSSSSSTTNEEPDLLSKINQFMEELKKYFEGLKSIEREHEKGRPAKTRIEDLMHNFAQRMKEFTEPQHREETTKALEKDQGSKVQVQTAVIVLIETFKKYKHDYKNARMAKAEKYTPQKESVELTLEAMLTRLSEVAQQINKRFDETEIAN